ncbi:hypothetical protein [Litoribacillus peritrichatus]|uniref:DUF948 domain-containing protein n=1 Tax=Litoribacillus peritrichatus TaxID=718191 RepID=A0ABP7N801_9GAMM
MENFTLFAQLTSFLLVLIAGVLLKRSVRMMDDAQEVLSRTETHVHETMDALKTKANVTPKVKLDTVTDAVDLSAMSIEKIHKTISDTSFDLIRSVKPAQKPTEAIHKAHDITAKGVYRSIRKVNRLVGDLSKSLQNEKPKPTPNPSDKDPDATSSD